MEDQLTTRIAELRRKQRAAATCSKCDGTGRVAEYAYVNNGQCYDCRGTGMSNNGLVACGDG